MQEYYFDETTREYNKVSFEPLLKINQIFIKICDLLWKKCITHSNLPFIFTEHNIRSTED